MRHEAIVKRMRSSQRECYGGQRNTMVVMMMVVLMMVVMMVVMAMVVTAMVVTAVDEGEGGAFLFR